MLLLVLNEIEADVDTKPHSLLKLLMSRTSCKAHILMLIHESDLTITSLNCSVENLPLESEVGFELTWLLVHFPVA